MWLAEGFSFGITAAGGTGHYLAQLMTEGEAEIDMASLDPKRFGGWMTTEYAARKNEECYNHVFVLHHPDEERADCRPLRTAPAYDRQIGLGAQMGQVNGWDRPNYYGPKDAPKGFDHDSRSFRRGGWWPYAVEAAKAVRNTVGIIDERPDELAGNLSYGQQKLLALARMLPTNAKVFMLDEPGSGLPRPMVAHMGSLMQRLAREYGKSVLLVDHNMELVAGLTQAEHHVSAHQSVQNAGISNVFQLGRTQVVEQRQH